MVRFALKTLLRKPLSAVILFTCLGVFSFLVSSALLIETGMEQTVRRAAESGPSLTVQPKNPKADAPSKPDIAAVQGVTGVVRAIPSSESPQEIPSSRMDVFVYADSEIDLVRQDILSALPWPAAVISKTTYTAAALREIASRGTLVWWVLLPAALALLYLFVGQALHPLNGRKEAALLKAMGWTSADILRFFSISTALLGLPATLLGAVGGWVFVRLGDTAVAESVLFGFHTGKSALPIDLPGAVFCLFVTVFSVFLLWVPAVLAPAVRAALGDPADFLQEDKC